MSGRLAGSIPPRPECTPSGGHRWASTEAQPTTIVATASWQRRSAPSGPVGRRRAGRDRHDSGRRRAAGRRSISPQMFGSKRSGMATGSPPPGWSSSPRPLGARLVLCEGGPHLIGDLVGAGLLDELFLTDRAPARRPRRRAPALRPGRGNGVPRRRRPLGGAGLGPSKRRPPVPALRDCRAPGLTRLRPGRLPGRRGAGPRSPPRVAGAIRVPETARSFLDRGLASVERPSSAGRA